MRVGTEIVFDDNKAVAENVAYAAAHFPLPVTCNGSKVDQGDFLHEAVHVEHWRGIRLGVRATKHYPGRRPELNFHGIRIENVRLPVIASMESEWHVRADVADCAELELVLPARKEIVETPFLEQLRTACRTAIYHAMLKVNAEGNTNEQISLPADVRADALAQGIELPVARAELARWWPSYLNEYSIKRGPTLRAALPDKPIVVDADIPPCDQVALWCAANRSGITQRLCAEEPRYRGYPWYDSLPKVKKVTTSVVIGGEELSIEDARTRREPLETARPERITFVLENRRRPRRGRARPHPRRRGVRRRRHQLGGGRQRARHRRQRDHARRTRGPDRRRVLLRVGRLRGRQLRDPAGRLPAGSHGHGPETARLGRRGDALERADSRLPLGPAPPAARQRGDHPDRQGQAHRGLEPMGGSDAEA